MAYHIPHPGFLLHTPSADRNVKPASPFEALVRPFPQSLFGMSYQLSVCLSPSLEPPSPSNWIFRVHHTLLLLFFVPFRSSSHKRCASYPGASLIQAGLPESVDGRTASRSKECVGWGEGTSCLDDDVLRARNHFFFLIYFPMGLMRSQDR